MDKMIGQRLLFTISEPWEFEDDNGFGSFEVTVVQTKGDALFVRANEDILIGSSKYDAFICSPRLEGDSIKQLKSKNDLWCSSTALPKDKVNINDPFDLSWWRGGGTLIGSLSTT